MPESAEHASEKTEFSLPEFISEKSELFVVLGVFSALSVYMIEISSNPSSFSGIWFQIGFLGPILISVLMLFLLYYQLYKEFKNLDQFLRGHSPFWHPDLLVFTTGMLLLSMSILIRILAYVEAIYLGMGILFAIAGTGVGFSINLFIEEHFLDELVEFAAEKRMLPLVIILILAPIAAYGSAEFVRFLALLKSY